MNGLRVMKHCLLVAIVLASSAAHGAIPASERSALVDLYTSTNGVGWTTSTNWNGAPGTECTWYGVTCNGGLTTVTQVRLGSNHLVGPLPATLGSLSSLTYLDLSTNQLSGSIPSFASNTALGALYLFNNQLTGSIPSFATNTALDLVYLMSNQLTGSIPSFATNTALQYLDLNGNQLTGGIPSFASNTALNFLDLAQNQLTGSIPSFASNTALTALNLYGNQLTGTIPSFASNTALQSLALEFNQLSGSIPSFAANTALVNLQLYWNQLGGSVPSFASNTALQHLDLSRNRLVGPVDASLGTLTNLVAGSGLDLMFNALSSTDAALIAFLNSKQTGGDWQSTQTIPVTGLSVTNVLATQATVNWTPIIYTGDTGNYQVFYATVSGGPYTPFATVTPDKFATSLTVTGLAPLTPYYFVVQTTTFPHGNNQNTVLSGYSAEVPSTTTPVTLMRLSAD